MSTVGLNEATVRKYIPKVISKRQILDNISFKNPNVPFTKIYSELCHLREWRVYRSNVELIPY